MLDGIIRPILNFTMKSPGKATRPLREVNIYNNELKCQFAGRFHEKHHNAPKQQE